MCVVVKECIFVRRNRVVLVEVAEVTDELGPAKFLQSRILAVRPRLKQRVRVGLTRRFECTWQ
jgi:hypothetical protein